MGAIELIPSAKRLMKSLRDMGYDFAQAVADIVDNSVEAGATLVAIDLEFDGDDSWVRVADNGRGMKPEELREAMRYGAEREYDKEDLGKFGLGLKTASMSQCRCLSVASRWNADRADIAAYAWDLGHIERTNRWEILPIERNGLGPAIREPLKNTTGTVVLWQRLDRILGYKLPYGEAARKRLAQMCREIETHLSMVFHRFLSGESQTKKFTLRVNGNEIEPWDPFARKEAKTRKLDSITIPIEHEGIVGEVQFQPYVLPHQDEFSSRDAFHAAGGPASWNQQQGFYIYRAGRMIQSGGWSNLRAADEHLKLARVAVSFLPILDDAFKINVAKMRVQLPSQIREPVRDKMAPVVKLARETYDRKQPQSVGTGSTLAQRKPLQSASEAPGTTLNSSDMSAAKASRSSSALTLEEWSREMLATATISERPIVESVLQRLRAKLPSRP